MARDELSTDEINRLLEAIAERRAKGRKTSQKTKRVRVVTFRLDSEIAQESEARDILEALEGEYKSSTGQNQTRAIMTALLLTHGGNLTGPSEHDFDGLLARLETALTRQTETILRALQGQGVDLSPVGVVEEDSDGGESLTDYARSLGNMFLDRDEIAQGG